MQRKFFLLVALLLVVMVGLFAVPLRAEEELAELTEDRVALIKRNCVEAQVAMQQLQQSDVVYRTNRGSSYEGTLRLMAAFNTRVAANKLTEPKLIEITGLTQKEVNMFRENYRLYEESLQRTIAINCVNQPVSFYQELQRSRTLRDKLRDGVVTIDNYVSDYGKYVKDLKLKLSKPEEGSTAQ